MTGPGPAPSLTVLAPDGAPEVAAGDDLAAMVAALVDLEDGDVVAVTSKVVAKAEGRVRAGNREEALAGETVRVVARRGPTAIVRTHHGLTLAAAGVDASNVASGHVVLLPADPDASARMIRRRLNELTGRTVGVLVTDTAGRPWREGQTDIAIGAAGLRVLESYDGRTDPHGNPLTVTAPAVADELAGAAELAQGKLGRRPFAVLRGRADLVLPVDDDGPGATALLRAEDADMFGYGAREAVVRALAGHPAAQAGFGAHAPADELVEALAELTGTRPLVDRGDVVVVAPDARVAWLVGVAAYAHGWGVVAATDDEESKVRLRALHPLP
jgi:coenzyme F420-0:L-glutamate ligase / coenzyme F420-1:gamma-L-glutamate ligase